MVIRQGGGAGGQRVELGGGGEDFFRRGIVPEPVTDPGEVFADKYRIRYDCERILKRACYRFRVDGVEAESPPSLPSSPSTGSSGR